ncbi:sugar ABC transporter substrate-binding protein [Ruminococcus gauvreauii]|uniref:Sugar ABC transporter substrate-binding protein n=1 Tax=Ruminococcus gauvreauii TaxID=438033 RepID=A0ABY5VJI7_9FIRM|nr:sugar ABC transporter substrate-binding protein [Ruminococcus gauvreauii]UWP60507.1 sugar ABC transporter substrate-binding protein [Ruminococcus gauvreauii]
MKRRLLAVLLTAGLVLSMTACGGKSEESASGSASEDTSAADAGGEADAGEADAADDAGGADAKDISIAVNLKTLNSEYWGNVKAGCDKAAEELGIEVTVNGPDAESEIAQQVTQIGDQLAQDVDAIIVAPCDTDAVSGALESASGEIPVFFIDQDVDFPGKTSFVGTSNVDAAKKGGQYVGEKIGKDAKVVIIYGQEGESTSNARTQGYKEGLAEFGIEPIAEMSGNNVSDTAKAAMEDLLTRFNNEIDAVLCMNDDTAIGALSACQDAGVADDITIIGFDGNQSAVELVAAGDLEATIAQQPSEMGYIAVMNAYKAINGETVEKEIPIDTIFITKDNAEEYLK